MCVCVCMCASDCTPLNHILMSLTTSISEQGRLIDNHPGQTYRSSTFLLNGNWMELGTPENSMKLGPYTLVQTRLSTKHTHMHTHTCTHRHTHTDTHTHTHTSLLTDSLNHRLTHTHAHSHTHTLRLTLTDTHTHTHTHFLTH